MTTAAGSRLLSEALASGGADAVVAVARRGRGPIVEPTADAGTYAVTFVYHERREESRRVGLFCPAVPGGFAMLQRLGDRLFAATFPMPAGARVRYHYCPRLAADPGPEAVEELERLPSVRRIDYFNPAIDQVAVPELRARLFESVLTVPGGRPEPWSEPRAGVPAGTVQTHTMRSRALGADRVVSVYLPPGHGPEDGPLPALLLLDGQHRWWGAPVLFDNLLHDRAAPPFVGVLVGCGRFSTRLRDLAGSPAQVEFVTGELLPWLATRCAIAATGHVAAGFSAGALAAAFLVLSDPVRFAGVAAVSGTFHLATGMDPLRPGAGSPWLRERFAAAPALPRRVYLGAGTFEAQGGVSLVEQSAGLAAVLRARGVQVRFDSGPTGHDTASARAHLAEGLVWTLGAGGP